MQMFPLLIICTIFVRLASFKCIISDRSDSIWRMRLFSWRQMPWWVVIWTTATPCLGVCTVSTCTNYSVFKSHLVGLSQTAIDTHGHPLFSNNSIGCQLNFAVFSRLPLWFISFFTVVIQAILVLFCQFVVEDMAQDITVQIKGSRKFLNTTHLYTDKKNTSVTVLVLRLTVCRGRDQAL